MRQQIQPFIAKKQGMKWTYRESAFAVGVTFVVMLAVYGLFGELAVSEGFLFWNLMVVVFFFICFHFLRKLALLHTARQFQCVVFFLSFGIRSFIMLGLYFLFYQITETAFDVEAMDALVYHDRGLEVAREIWQGRFDLHALSSAWGAHFDDTGYVAFLGFAYTIFDGSIIAARLVQCVLDSFSVVLLYKITKSVWGEKAARSAAILSMLFPLQILYVALHLKETLMIFCLLSGTLGVVRLSQKLSAKALFLVVFGVIGLASTRTALLLIFMAAIPLFYIFNRARSALYRAAVCFLVLASLVASLSYFGIDREVYPKAMRLVGLGEEKSERLGGRSLELVASRGQTFAKVISLPLLAAQGFLAPYPSMVRTNIVFFNQTMQWYQIGALFVWGYLCFFGLYGLYYSIRFHFSESLFLSALVFGYTMALVISVYIMSIRINVIKLVLFLPFIALGMTSLPKARLWLWYLYCGVFAFVVLAWNYIKLYGRGSI